MARKMNNKRRKKVYYNNSKDSWVDDGKEQYSLHPGQITDDNLLKQEEELEKAEQKEIEEKKPEIEEALEQEQQRQKKMRDNVLWYKSYRRIRKDDQVAVTQKIASEALGRPVSAKTMNDELYNDAVDMDSFKKDALSDYAHELAHKEAVPVRDTDHDGDIDNDDEPGPKTKAQRRMERYL